MSIDPIKVDMEIYKDVKKVFMPKFHRYEPVNIDHTAIITAKECLRKYFFQIVLGRTSKEEAIWFPWGTSYHKFRQKLEETFGIGDKLPRDSEGRYRWNEERDYPKALLAYAVGVNAGMRYWKEKGRDQETTSKFNFMTAKRLELSFKVAFEHWKQEKRSNKVEVIAIEQPFNILLPDGRTRSGTSDQIIRWEGNIWGRDFKTTSKDAGFYERTLSPNDQFTGYTYSEAKLSGENVTGQVIEVLYNAKGTKQGEKGPEILTYTATRTDYQINDWLRGHTFWTDTLDKARLEDNYAMSEKSCSFCPFHKVCQSKTEAGAAYILETEYDLRPWDHTKVGEE